jgi:hypothetical protein
MLAALWVLFRQVKKVDPSFASKASIYRRPGSRGAVEHPDLRVIL